MIWVGSVRTVEVTGLTGGVAEYQEPVWGTGLTGVAVTERVQSGVVNVISQKLFWVLG